LSDLKSKSSMAPDLIIYTDGAARGNPGPAASGFVVFSANNRIYEESKYLEVATNNIAEHTAVLMALEWLQKNFANQRKIIFFNIDSLLVVRQLNGDFKVKSLKILEVVKKSKSLEKELGLDIRFNHIPREENADADTLVNRELDEQLQSLENE